MEALALLFGLCLVCLIVCFIGAVIESVMKLKRERKTR